MSQPKIPSHINYITISFKEIQGMSLSVRFITCFSFSYSVTVYIINILIIVYIIWFILHIYLYVSWVIVELILHWIQGKMMMKACCASCWCGISGARPSPSPTDPTPGRCEFLSWTGADFPLPREAGYGGRCRHQFRNPETNNRIMVYR